jgi:hypothetical protein
MQEQNMNISRLPFEIWKSTLRQNCSLKGKLTAFDCLGEYVLRILWERGLEPTPDVISEDAKHEL